MTSIHFHYAVDGGCSFHRALQPVRFCHDDLIEQGIQLSVGQSLRDDVDWLVFHSLPGNSATLHEVLRLKRKGVKLCWSLDDDLAAIPDWNPAKIGEDGMVVFDIMALAADAVIVSVPELGRVLWERHDYCEPVFICPNLLDLSTFPESPFDGASFADTTVQWPIRVVWAGSQTHKGDIAAIEDALIRLVDKHGPKTVSVVFAGSLPPPDLMRKHLHLGVMTCPQVPFNQYRRFANTLDPQIWLAPLADVPFNLSKSHLRVMEGWALGGCVVASAIGEYNRIRDGFDGFLCSTSDQWFATLDRLVMDHQSRIQVAADGRRRAVVECDWRRIENRKPWIDALKALSGM